MRLHPVSPGDIVDIVAPASACSPSELKKSIAALRALELVPRVPSAIFGKSVLFSNADSIRLAHLQRAIYAPDSKLIWCLRGGYGAIRLMPAIERWKRPDTAKILLGYSDITTLHVFLNQKWKWPTLHGPLFDRLGNGRLTAVEGRELFGLLFGQKTQVEFNNLTPMNAPARRSRILRAPIFGGNMTVLQSSLGTVSAFKPKPCFLFFEDTGERPHRVDRMLTQFAQAGWFTNCHAILLGDFVLKEARDRRHLWQDVFARFAASVNFPVVRGLPLGHHPDRQHTIPLNTSSELRLGNRVSLTVQSGIRHS